MAQENVIMERFERLKRVAENGSPYWLGREIMQALEYADWRDFRQAIERAQSSCEMAGHFSANHFVPLPELVVIGNGGKRERENFALSRYACYLVAMNGDPVKPEVAVAQAYFVEQTFKQERQEKLTEEEHRAVLRDRLKDANRRLFGAAKSAGVSSRMFGIFNDAGYRGLYGGIGLKAIRQMKGIGAKDDLLDCIGPSELAANEFRATQAEDKLRRDRVRGEASAIETHRAVGAAVRRTIKKIGGTMPEKLPAAPSIKGFKRKALGAADGSEQGTVRQLAAPHDAESAGTREDDKDEAR